MEKSKRSDEVCVNPYSLLYDLFMYLFIFFYISYLEFTDGPCPDLIEK